MSGKHLEKITVRDDGPAGGYVEKVLDDPYTPGRKVRIRRRVARTRRLPPDVQVLKADLFHVGPEVKLVPIPMKPEAPRDVFHVTPPAEGPPPGDPYPHIATGRRRLRCGHVDGYCTCGSEGDEEDDT